MLDRASAPQAALPNVCCLPRYRQDERRDSIQSAATVDSWLSDHHDALRDVLAFRGGILITISNHYEVAPVFIQAVCQCTQLKIELGAIQRMKYADDAFSAFRSDRANDLVHQTTPEVTSTY